MIFSSLSNIILQSAIIHWVFSFLETRINLWGEKSPSLSRSPLISRRKTWQASKCILSGSLLKCCGCVESYRTIKFSGLEILLLSFLSFFFPLHLHFNRLYHVGKCFNLLNTWKVYFRLALGVWKSLARRYSACSQCHPGGKILPAGLPLLQSGAPCSLWENILRTGSPARGGGRQPLLLTLGLVDSFRFLTELKAEV